MPEFLIFTLWAPLGAMGEIAVGERRTGFDRPAKSAIAGLLAAALGVERREEERLLALAEGYGMAVRADAPGAIVYDYHTIQAPSSRKGVRWPTRRAALAETELNTIVSKREYRESPWFTVALWARPSAPESLAALAAALARPRFALYFGRKACPLGLPPSPLVIESPDLAAAFEEYDRRLPDFVRRLRARVCRPRSLGRLHLDAEDAALAGEAFRSLRIERRRDRLLSRRRWQFGLRAELVAELGRARS
ncbi:MAG: type I-E CRISPR-associated protein Cas5/CasD [Geminicoccaceae bacterium]|nr:type I-E CRISPR-associated protein Cas5/CasD [Geminicoccaceae bacterium]MCS7269102.1 type I-E CRISPR-associated protein Cas5/CasD [Geminicoccaceae bacterium]MDW8126096.1 type I-E CRISPR-associated protein Cas5/CasD [Geminicoccaceae bacterium]MDW8342756.1 type I-E CRISPR-associated protein Cas5/CasD [Geminicoccaceae bacterium]